METTDVLVIGGGVFGLAAARCCTDAGLSVILCEGSFIGATHQGAASSGVVGALTPHRPENWRAFKEFQLDALISLPEWMAGLQAETGTDPGYRQNGRVTPLTCADQRARADAQAADAETNWRGAGRFEVLDAVPEGLDQWLEPAACSHGVVHDTLSAQVAPRRYLEALADCLDPRIDLREGWFCVAIDPETAVARFPEGEIEAGHVILAAGTRVFNLIELMTKRRLGGGVKGQAALLACDPGVAAAPVIQSDGIYVIDHGNGQVAVGSTTEKRWDNIDCDGLLEDVIGRARALSPILADAPVTHRWAGLRPRASATVPMIGPLPDTPRVIAAAGGYKIGLAIAHVVGGAVAAMVQGRPALITVPEECDPSAHFDQGSADLRDGFDQLVQ